eukprot:2880820-Pyramimonas_sp.AAC.1
MYATSPAARTRVASPSHSAKKERKYHAATTTTSAGHHLRRRHYPKPIHNELTQSRKCSGHQDPAIARRDQRQTRP